MSIAKLIWTQQDTRNALVRARMGAAFVILLYGTRDTKCQLISLDQDMIWCHAFWSLDPGIEEANELYQNVHNAAE